MKKMKVLLSIWILFLIMYNMVVFLIPVERTKSFFIAYAFSMVFSLAVAGVTLIECGSDRKVKSRFLDLDIAYIGIIGLILQIAWGLTSKMCIRDSYKGVNGNVQHVIVASGVFYAVLDQRLYDQPGDRQFVEGRVRMVFKMDLVSESYGHQVRIIAGVIQFTAEGGGCLLYTSRCV